MAPLIATFILGFCLKGSDQACQDFLVKEGASMALRLCDVRRDPIANRALAAGVGLCRGSMKLFFYKLDDLIKGFHR